MAYYCNTMQRDVLRFMSLAAVVITIGLGFFIMLRWRALKVGVQVVRAAGQPLHTMKQIIACPFISLFFGLAVIGGLAGVFALTMSAGSIEITTNSEAPDGQVKTLVFNTEERYFVIYNLLATIWWIAFVSALGEAVMSTAVSSWYFSRGHTAVYSPLLKAFKLCFVYHLGTICVGSFLHTVLWLPASVLSLISSSVRSSVNKRNSCANCIAVSCCCLETHERFLKFLHKRAYMFVRTRQMGMFGTRYLVSAKKSYFLTFRNKHRIGLALQGAEFMTSLVKTVVTLAGTCFVMWYLLNEGSTFTGTSIKDLSSVTGPMVLGLIACWYVGQVFGGSLDACVSTSLLCTACDEEMFSRAQRFANPELNAILDPLASEKHDELLPMSLAQAPKESSKRHKLGPIDDNGVDAVINTYAYDNPDSARPQYQGLSPFDDDVVTSSRSTHQPNLFYNRPDTTRSGRTPDAEQIEDGRPSFSPSSGSQMSRSSRRTGSRQR